jgi:hypothetical protein
MTLEFTPLMPPIPPTFRSIDEAKDCLNSCLCALFHGVMTSHIHGLGNQTATESPSPANTTNADALQEWAQTFGSFQTQQKGTQSSKEQQAEIVVQIQYMTGSILVSAGAY